MITVSSNRITGNLLYFPTDNVCVELEIGNSFFRYLSGESWVEIDTVKNAIRKINSVIEERRKLAEQIGLELKQLHIKGVVSRRLSYNLEFFLEGDNEFYYLEYSEEIPSKIRHVKYTVRDNNKYIIEKKEVFHTKQYELKEEDLVNNRIRYKKKEKYETGLFVYEKLISDVLEVNPVFLAHDRISKVDFFYFNGKRHIVSQYSISGYLVFDVSFHLPYLSTTIRVIDQASLLTSDINLPALSFRNPYANSLIRDVKELLQLLSNSLKPSEIMKQRTRIIIDFSKYPEILVNIYTRNPLGYINTHNEESAARKPLSKRILNLINMFKPILTRTLPNRVELTIDLAPFRKSFVDLRVFDGTSLVFRLRNLRLEDLASLTLIKELLDSRKNKRTLSKNIIIR